VLYAISVICYQCYMLSAGACITQRVLIVIHRVAHNQSARRHYKRVHGYDLYLFARGRGRAPTKKTKGGDVSVAAAVSE
jgi:hypothetical protein